MKHKCIKTAVLITGITAITMKRNFFSEVSRNEISKSEWIA